MIYLILFFIFLGFLIVALTLSFFKEKVIVCFFKFMVFLNTIKKFKRKKRKKLKKFLQCTFFYYFMLFLKNKFKIIFCKGLILVYIFFLFMCFFFLIFFNLLLLIYFYSFPLGFFFDQLLIVVTSFDFDFYCLDNREIILAFSFIDSDNACLTPKYKDLLSLNPGTIGFNKATSLLDESFSYK